MTRTEEFWSDKLGRSVSDAEAAEGETDRTAQGGAVWRLELVQAEPRLDETFDFEDWLATALVDYWCSIHEGGRGK